MKTEINEFLSQADLKQLFIHQLNRVNCTKGYLIRHLPPLAEIASFHNMQLAILEALDDSKKQQARVDEIYNILDSKASDDGCEVVKAVIEEAYQFGNHSGKTKIMNDMDIILYMCMIENLALTSFRMLQLINQFMGDERIKQLLKECCDENVDNDRLFTLISEEYLAQKVLE
jgi:ferritin-like metal-binding protein YciE